MKYLLYLFKRLPFKLKFVYLLSLILTNSYLIFDIISPIYFGKFLDSLITMELDYKACLIMFLIIVFSTILPIIGLYVYHKSDMNISIELRVFLFNTFVKLPQSEIKRKSDVFYARVINEDVSALMNMFRPDLYVSVFQIIRSIVILVVITKYSLWLLIPFSLLFLLSFVFAYLAQNKTYEDNKKVDEKLGEILSFISESLANNTIIHFFNYDFIRQKIYKKLSKQIGNYYFDIFKKHNVYTNVLGNITSFILHIVIYVLAIYLVISKKISIGNLSIIISYFALIGMQYGTLSTFSNTFSMVKANVIRIAEIISKISEKKKAIIYNTESVKLVIDDFRDQYSNVKIEKLELFNNNIYGIVGVSGAGKTSLFNSILGDSETTGNITINSYDSKEFDYSEIIGIMDQGKSIINETAKANILMGYDFNETEFNHIVNDLKIQDLVKRDDKLGVNGCNLSTGEKQKISYARFLYSLKFKKVLILDEPFANMDLISKNNCIKVLQEYILPQHLVLFISHDIHDVIKISNKLLVFENYKVVEYSKGEFEKSPLVKKLLKIAYER